MNFPAEPEEYTIAFTSDELDKTLEAVSDRITKYVEQGRTTEDCFPLQALVRVHDKLKEAYAA